MRRGVRRGWLGVALALAIVGVVEVLSDSVLDPHLPFPRDTLLVMATLTLTAVVFAREVFRRIDNLTDTLRLRNAELESRSASARALHRVSVAIAALVRIDEILQVVVDNARQLLDADIAFLVLEEPDGTEHLSATSGPPEALRRAGDLAGSGIARFTTPEFLQGQLVASLQRGDTAVGVLAVGCRSPRTFGKDELETLASLANEAAIALENDRLQRELRELAIRAERERIAREMHDGLAQVLGYVNTKSQAVEELLSGGRVEAARSQLAELSTAARSVYVDVREAILGLTSPISPERGLAGALEEYAVRFSEASKLATIVEATPVVRGAVLPPEAQAQVFRVVQEALTNVRKHASAARAVVSLDIVDGALEVEVADDGRGFDPAAPPPVDWPHYGLQAMRERVAMLGGTLEVHAAPGEGTRVRVSVPLGAWTPVKERVS